MRPLNVIHIIGALPVGGVERNLLRLLPRLDRERFRVQVVTIRERGELATAMEAAGVPVHLSFMKNRYHLGSLRRLARLLRELGADIAHCHMRRANTSGRLAAMWARVPVRLAHERDLGLGKRWRHYLVDRFLGMCNGPVLCVTQAVMEHNRVRSGLPASSFVVQYNGLDLAPYLAPQDRVAARQRFGLPLNRPLLGNIGRLHVIKELPLLLEALAQVKVELPPPCLVLVGEGREREALAQRATALGVADRVVFLPWQHDLPPLYAALDAFVFTSRSEGIANVQLEAAAAGVPLVSTPVGIASEAFVAGQDYIAVDWSPESVAAGIAEALSPARAAELICRGREAVKAFSLERQQADLEDLYRRLWEETGTTAATTGGRDGAR